ESAKEPLIDLVSVEDKSCVPIVLPTPEAVEVNLLRVDNGVLATAADTVAPPEVVDDKASKIIEEEVIKTIEAADKAVLEEEIIPKSIQANTDYMENKIDEASKDTKTHFELQDTKLKVTELDLNINFNMKIAKAEENLGQKIDENSSRLSTVEETLSSLLKAQQEQNETNKALTYFLVTNFL
ncbi:hypothetical protein Dimus_003538, partial [Dionaea muscipula]